MPMPLSSYSSCSDGLCAPCGRALAERTPRAYASSMPPSIQAVPRRRIAKSTTRKKAPRGAAPLEAEVVGISSGEGRLARLRSWASARRPSLPALCGHGSGIGCPWWSPEGRHARRHDSCSGVRVRLRMPSVSSLENGVPHDPRAEILASWPHFCYHPRTQASGFRFRRRQDKRA